MVIEMMRILRGTQKSRQGYLSKRVLALGAIAEK